MNKYRRDLRDIRVDVTSKSELIKIILVTILLDKLFIIRSRRECREKESRRRDGRIASRVSPDCAIQVYDVTQEMRKRFRPFRVRMHGHEKQRRKEQSNRAFLSRP